MFALYALLRNSELYSCWKFIRKRAAGSARENGVLREGIVTAPKRALCRASGKAEVALVSLHRWEEPCISGSQGAGTVFFSHCNLRCCFCQNHEISAEGSGFAVTDERLAEIFLEQQSRGATCLELVTPTHYVENIIRAIDIARSRGFSLRVAYNTNGYDLPETIGRLRGYVDMYMPDLKYFDSGTANAIQEFRITLRRQAWRSGPCLTLSAGIGSVRTA